MKTNSKNIGNNYEREFSKVLSFWLTGDENKDVCWRDVGSGARHTVRAKEGKETARKADIVATDLYYQPFFDTFYIDTKSYKKFNPIIINTKNIKSNSIFHQWVKTVEECPSNMIPIMPCKIRDSKTPEFLLLPYNCNFEKLNYMKYKIMYNNNNYVFYFVLQKEFFCTNNWSIFLQNNKKNL